MELFYKDTTKPRLLKGLYVYVQVTLHAKMTTVPLKDCLIKYKIDIFFSLNCLLLCILLSYKI